MKRLEINIQQQQPWAIRKKLITEKYSFLTKEELKLVDCNPSEFIERLQLITGLTRAEIISQIENI